MDQLSLKVIKDENENVQININGENLIEIIKRIEIQFDKSIAGEVGKHLFYRN